MLSQVYMQNFISTACNGRHVLPVQMKATFGGKQA